MKSAAQLRSLLIEAQELGFLGPGDIATHFVVCERFSAALSESNARVCLDLGSGAGVPGLLLAFEDRARLWVLLEAMEKRVRFLRSWVAKLRLEQNVTIVHERAENAARSSLYREKFDAVTARGFGPPATTAECAVGFLRLDGEVIVSDPEESTDRWQMPALHQLGLEVVEDGGEFLTRLRKAAPTDVKFPRKNGRPRKSPLV